MNSFTIKGNFVDLFERKIFPAIVNVAGGKIQSITKIDEEQSQFILPGFVDAHVHIESSMLVPTAFARLAVIHGTVATISDPHEIANVNGLEGVQYMIDNSKQTPFKFFFGAPSCVPATFFETAGAVIDAKSVEELLKNDDIWYLSEMMNYPGVIYEDQEVISKLLAAQKIDKPIDGHAPGLRGENLKKYASHGIVTDHESFTLDEALEKIENGMHCLIREGSAAKNFDALVDVIKTHPEKVMFCTDDKHPDELLLHHIDNHVKRALKKGCDLFDVLRAASINPVLHYKVPVGLLRINDPADFIVVNNLQDFDVLQTYINGKLVAEKGVSLLPHMKAAHLNKFYAILKTPEDFEIKAEQENSKIRVIEALEGQLITNELLLDAKVKNGTVISDVENDILKIAVINRYEPNSKPAIAFIKNFGIKKGAIASTVAHDCHNIIAVGVDDSSLCAAVNMLIKTKGGISVAENEHEVHCLPLPIAGLMSDEDGYVVAEKYTQIDKKAKQLGTKLKAPFMTLSFMALLVIPALKLSDKGLFDGNGFKFTSVFSD